MIRFAIDPKYKKSDEWIRLVEATRLTYDKIAELSDARVIVDNSKSAIHFALLIDAFGKDRVGLIHQVRDPRGVSYAWSRNTKKINTKNGPKKFPTRPYIQSGVRWFIENYILEQTTSKITNKYQLIYEEFTAKPMRTLSDLLHTLGYSEDINQIIDADGVANCANNTNSHAIGGNPMRQNAEKLAIRPDNDWKDKLSLYDKIILGLITYPLLRHYGYYL